MSQLGPVYGVAFGQIAATALGHLLQDSGAVALRLVDGEVVHIRSGKHRVDINPELRSRLDDLLGNQSHKLIVNKPKMKPPAERTYRNQKS